MAGRSFVSVADFSRTEILELLATAKAMKADPRGGRPLDRRVLAMIFEKPSLRTRVSFETGMAQLGGATINLAPGDIKMGARESVEDVARVMGRLCDGIMARVFAHDTVTRLAAHAGVPVINGLSDVEHPCQALADFLTIDEHKDLASRPVVAYVGDGNNVCHSLLLLGAILGLEIRVGCPRGYEPATAVLARCPTATVSSDPRAAVAGADVVYTDVWASMGQEDSAAERRELFRDYQVNEALFSLADPQAIFLHCLPAHRGEEVTDPVLDGPRSQVLDQAENRLHAQKAVLAKLLAE